MNRTIVTAQNIEEVKQRLPSDQAQELIIGCETWTFIFTAPVSSGYYEEIGVMTYWPETGRAAMCTNGDSFWGDWDGEILSLDDTDEWGRPLRYYANGEEILWEEEEQYASSMLHVDLRHTIAAYEWLDRQQEHIIF